MVNTRKIVPGILQRLAWPLLRLIFKIFLSLRIKGLNNLKKFDKNFILASNHTWEIDPLVVVASLPFFSRYLPLFFVSREKGFYRNKSWRRYIYGGLIFKSLGAYQAYVGLGNYELSLRNHLDILQGGGNVYIFPTGGVHREDRPRKAKGGVSFLAYKTKLPILPIHIDMRRAEKMTLLGFLLRKYKLTLTFGEPIYVRDILKNPTVNKKRNDYEKVATAVMQKIEELDGGYN